MQSLNKKEIAIKTLLILISILSIILIKEGIDSVNSSVELVENMGGFDIYPINSPDTIVQGWYYGIIANILFTLYPTIVLILSIVSMFIRNRTIEISIIAQTFLTLLLEATANHEIGNIIENKIGYYQYIGLILIVMLIIIILSVIKKKSIFILYILGLILLIVKYIEVYMFWFYHAREDMTIIQCFDMYGIKYTIVTILGFCVLMLKIKKQSSKFIKSL